MEYALWKAVVEVLTGLPQRRRSARQAFGDCEIAAVYFWAVVHDRPVSWACCPVNWPIHRRRHHLPSSATMSRRLRTASVLTLLQALERHVGAPREGVMFWMVDGKPLPIGGCSKDRQAGYGRAAGGKAKGYKIHVIAAADGSIAAWRLAPMNKDERVMAGRMLKSTPLGGYLVADANYDSNPLHAICDKQGDLQLVTPRRYGPGRGTGHKRQTPGRLRSIALTESPIPGFAQRLMTDRSAIERCFGNMTNWWAGLSCLPAWVRTYHRVHLWVQAKLTLNAIKRWPPTWTYVNS